MDNFSELKSCLLSHDPVAQYETDNICPNMASLALLFTSLGLSYAQGFANQCRNFRVSIPNVEVNVLEFVPSGTNLTFPYSVCPLSH